ncbi:MAG: fused MFS/spermidine synthase, partial [Bdellovibrionales bacterium]|nr:fused MFS/spermidine synthase [Bdellovibrionales bacterium]
NRPMSNDDREKECVYSNSLPNANIEHIKDCVAALIAGLSVMVVEIVGLRDLAPALGNSIEVWSTVIGIVLLSLSIGAWIGGYVADRISEPSLIGIMLFISGTFVLVVSMTSSFISAFAAKNVESLHIAALFTSIVLYAPPVMLLGMVPILAIRKGLSDPGTFGRSVGRISFLSTFGSIVGTFASGYWLLPFVGARASFISVGTALLLFSCLYSRRLFAGTLVILVGAGIINRNWLESEEIVETRYSRLTLRIEKERETGRMVKSLRTDPFVIQSAIYLDDLDQHSKGSSNQQIRDDFLKDGYEPLVLPYTRFFRLSSYFVPNPKTVLMIGGGAFSFPRVFLDEQKNAVMDVVELDPALFEIAKSKFGLTPSDRMKVYSEDARYFLNRNQTKYDVIIVDAFTNAQVIPNHLVSKEAFATIYNALSDNGAVILNCISSFTGETSGLFYSLLSTLKDEFPKVRVFAVKTPEVGYMIQNIILVGLKNSESHALSASARERGLLAHEWHEKSERELSIIKDDLAVTDRYASSLASALKH